MSYRQKIHEKEIKVSGELQGRPGGLKKRGRGETWEF
jgi:hypothetical protein